MVKKFNRISFRAENPISGCLSKKFAGSKKRLPAIIKENYFFFADVFATAFLLTGAFFFKVLLL
ncbi:MAG: hypothetical protein ACYDBV_07905 [Nitrospiria bacterium]